MSKFVPRSMIAWSVLPILSLSACATSGPVPKPGCEVYRPVYLDREDNLTDRTLRAILANNETWERICQ